MLRIIRGVGDWFQALSWLWQRLICAIVLLAYITLILLFCILLIGVIGELSPDVPAEAVFVWFVSRAAVWQTLVVAGIFFTMVATSVLLLVVCLYGQRQERDVSFYHWN